MEVPEPYQDLIEEILDELLLQGPRGEETVKISTKKLSDKVAVGGSDSAAA